MLQYQMNESRRVASATGVGHWRQGKDHRRKIERAKESRSESVFRMDPGTEKIDVIRRVIAADSDPNVKVSLVMHLVILLSKVNSLRDNQCG